MAIYNCNNCSNEQELKTVTSTTGLFLAKSFPHRKVEATCIECGSTDLSICIDNANLSNIQLGKFQMKSIEERKQQLQLRSKKHFKKRVEGVKQDMIKNYNP